jgi:glycosyltransferase involved in cell wall biosynthesis
MPTGNRTDFALQAIRYFQRQDYPARELIIIDDGSEQLSERLPEDSRIRYYQLESKLSIGAKRNKACELARGSIIAQWDDDDWYAPNRLSAQVAPLLTGVADISGITGTTFFVLDSWEFWRCSQQLHSRLFVEDVHGGTLMYKQNIWAQLARYPDISLAEDATFLRYAIHRGARLHRIPNQNLFVYLRHASNSWSFDCSQYLDPQGWQRIDEPALQAADRAFYAAHSSTAPHAPQATSLTQDVAV